MPITRSRDNLMNLEEPANVSFTVDVASSSNNRNKRTPKQKQGLTNTVTNNNNTIEIDPNQNEELRIRQIVSENMNSFRNEMMNIISSELRSLVQELNSQTNGVEGSSTNNIPCISDRSNPTIPQQEPISSEKVLNIIRNWSLKFTGHNNSMSVDEFIYRVNILTTNNLRGDFETLCKHAHSLFEGKALEWYWRYHRHTNDFDWFSLTNALRIQYKQDYSDFDILDEMRRRKQKPTENFDEFYDAISAITDKLRTPISDIDLCETLIRNLKLEVRHELLHLEISSVSQLRREVRKHEKFMSDLHESRRTIKGRISEMTSENEILSAKDIVNEDEVCALNAKVICWNCDKTGHTYFDCLAPRTVFCYGCGAKNIYKPNCLKCSNKASGNGQKDVRRT